MRWLLAEPWRPFALIAIYGAAGVTICLWHLIGLPLIW